MDVPLPGINELFDLDGRWMMKGNLFTSFLFSSLYCTNNITNQFQEMETESSTVTWNSHYPYPIPTREHHIPSNTSTTWLIDTCNMDMLYLMSTCSSSARTRLSIGLSLTNLTLLWLDDD